MSIFNQRAAGMIQYELGGREGRVRVSSEQKASWQTTPDSGNGFLQFEPTEETGKEKREKKKDLLKLFYSSPDPTCLNPTARQHLGCKKSHHSTPLIAQQSAP